MASCWVEYFEASSSEATFTAPELPSGLARPVREDLLLKPLKDPVKDMPKGRLEDKAWEKRPGPNANFLSAGSKSVDCGQRHGLPGRRRYRA